MRRISEIAYDVMPADCSLDFERISSPQPPAITTRKVPDSLWCRWHKSIEIVWESAWGMTNAWKRESANDTHHAHSTMAGSRPGMSTNQEHVFGVTTHFSQVH